MVKSYKIDKSNVENILELTSLQEGILYHYLKNVNQNLYFVQLALEIEGMISIDNFIDAWKKVVSVNEMLRTVFRWEKLKKPLQIVLKENDLKFNFYDFSGHDKNQIEELFLQIKLNDKNEEFDLREVPFRLTLCKLDSEKYILLISNHHILYDGGSTGIILK